MVVSLVQLILENPFSGLSLSLDASDRNIQHRLDEIEMDSLLGGAASDDFSKLQQNARLLEDPDQRIVCEFYAPWFNTDFYSRVSDEHDRVLQQTITFLTSPNDSQASDYVSALRGWIAVAGNESVRIAVEHRSQSLGTQLSSDWLRHEIGTRLVPLVVDRLLHKLGSQADELHNLGTNGVQQIAEILEDLGAPFTIPGFESLARYLESIIDPSLLEDLTTDQLIGLIGSIDAIANSMSESSRQLWRRLTRSLYERSNLEAHRRFEAGDSESAEEILEALSAASLSELDNLDVRKNLNSLRFGMLMERAFRFAEAGMWRDVHDVLQKAKAIAPPDQAAQFEVFLSAATYNLWWTVATEHLEALDIEEAISALSNAYRHAQSQDQRDETSSAIAALRMRKPATGRKSPSSFGWRKSGVVIGLITAGCIVISVILASFDDSDQGDSDVARSTRREATVTPTRREATPSPTLVLSPADLVVSDLSGRSDCDALVGEPSILNAPQYQQSRPNTVIVLHSSEESGGGLAVHQWDVELPAEWKPVRVADIPVIVCIHDGREEVERCRYIPSGLVYRWRRTKEIRVVEASTGQVLESREIKGAIPRPCPQTTYQERRDLSGNSPELDLEEFIEILRPVVDPE